MTSDSIRRNMPVFSMRIVMQLTELTARQIRYYEQQQLIIPKRTEGNQRVFSMNDLDQLLEIKMLLEKGFNMKGIKQIILDKKEGNTTDISKSREKIYLKEVQGHLSDIPLNRGDLSRFYK